MKLRDLLGAVHATVTDPADELKEHLQFIDYIQHMAGAERDTIRATFQQGPLFDGDLPSKSARDTLVEAGFLARVVVNGQEDYNACTYKGARAYRLIELERQHGGRK